MWFFSAGWMQKTFCPLKKRDTDTRESVWAPADFYLIRSHLCWIVCLMSFECFWEKVNAQRSPESPESITIFFYMKYDEEWNECGFVYSAKAWKRVKRTEMEEHTHTHGRQHELINVSWLRSHDNHEAAGLCEIPIDKLVEESCWCCCCCYHCPVSTLQYHRLKIYARPRVRQKKQNQLQSCPVRRIKMRILCSTSLFMKTNAQLKESLVGWFAMQLLIADVVAIVAQLHNCNCWCGFVPDRLHQVVSRRLHLHLPLSFSKHQLCGLRICSQRSAHTQEYEPSSAI